VKELIEQYKKTNTLHHFHILVGNRSASQQQLVDFCEKTLDCSTQGNPSFINMDADRLLIDDVKKIVSRSFIKTESGGKMIFCISFNDITRESQNALLKVIEEPSAETYFFLIAPRKDIFLPTVLSRAVMVEVDGTTETDDSFVEEVVGDILDDKKDLGEKLKVVDTVVKKIKDKKIERGVAREIVKKIIIELDRDAVKNSTALRSLQKIDDYLGDTGASVKLLLERVVLSV